MKNKLIIIIVFSLFFQSCFVISSFKNPIIVEDTDIMDDFVMLEEIEVTPQIFEFKEYKPSRQKINIIKHTKLDIRFDWAKQQTIGKATLTISPYFYQTDSLTLDAKHFDIKRVALIDKKDTTNLKYDYDDFQLKIKLNKTYLKSEEYTIFIDYVAKSSEISNTGNRVYSDTKGLYFINAESKNKPKQIWTQGETEYSSCWFPTIDSPNQRCTGEISITVPAKYLTLSNGELQNTLLNKDTTRTDYWKMDLPIAPYLFMIFVGEYEIVKDSWNGLDVNYYVPAGEEDYAKTVFGKTPEMIEFYSTKFNYEYPWNKYSQVVVEDFVSGAMENTTATVFGDFMLNKNSWWYSDLDKELVVAHELSHHWFGDLVTCESWANISLNESFATYAEYLWLEYKYSKEEADYQLYNEESYYINETQKSIFDFHYDNKDDMFSTLAYQKGARVLNILRSYVGDEAFFLGISTYLKKYEYKSVEINDLRLVFEEITGEDLNWFFNQWFLGTKYPDLTITHNTENENFYEIEITQNIEKQNNQLFYLPIDVAIYFKDTIKFERIFLTKQSQTFDFYSDEMPEFIDIDPNRILFFIRYEILKQENFYSIYNHNNNGIAKLEALTYYNYFIESDKELSKKVLFEALDSESFLVRNFALENYKFDGWKSDENYIKKLKYIKENDNNFRNKIKAENILSNIKE